MLLQRVRDVQRVGARDLRGADRVDACRHLVDIYSHAGDRRRRGRVDKNPAHVPGGGREAHFCLRPTGLAAAAGGRYLDGGQHLAASGAVWA